MDNFIVEFGKLKGQTFKNALENNKSYCKWLGSQRTESIQVKCFQQYLLERGVVEELNNREPYNGEKPQAK